MYPEWTKSLREKLDQHHAWPELYTFKFIVPKEKGHEVIDLFPNHDHTQRASKNGNYTSITVQMMMPSTDAVLDVYIAAAKIEGIIAL
jgi:hypothetical protein